MLMGASFILELALGDLGRWVFRALVLWDLGFFGKGYFAVERKIRHFERFLRRIEFFFIFG